MSESFHITSISADGFTTKRGPAPVATDTSTRLVPVVRVLKPRQERLERLAAPLIGDRCLFRGTYEPAPTVKATDIFRET